MAKETLNETKTKVIIVAENEVSMIEVAASKEDLLKLLGSFQVPHDASITCPPDVPPHLSHDDGHVFIYKGNGYKKVALRDIAYLEARRNYCEVYLANGHSLSLSMPMNEVHEYLPPRLFKRVHRSFVVNLEHVDTYIGGRVVLKDGKEISIGREYRTKVQEEFILIGSRKRVKEKKSGTNEPLGG